MRNSFQNSAPDIHFKRSASEVVFLSDEEIAEVPNFKMLIDYLSSVTDTGKFPNRKSINPSNIKTLLPDLYILDIERENDELTDLVLRLMGTNVAQFYGEHSGKSIQAMENKEAVQRIKTCAQVVLAERRNVAVRVAALSSDRQHLNVSVLYCPLAKEDQVIDQIIGLAVVSSGIR